MEVSILPLALILGMMFFHHTCCKQFLMMPNFPLYFGRVACCCFREVLHLHICRGKYFFPRKSKKSQQSARFQIPRGVEIKFNHSFLVTTNSHYYICSHTFYYICLNVSFFSLSPFLSSGTNLIFFLLPSLTHLLLLLQYSQQSVNRSINKCVYGFLWIIFSLTKNISHLLLLIKEQVCRRPDNK